MTILQSLCAFDPDVPGASFRGWVATIRHRKLTDLWRKARSPKEQKLHAIHTESVIGVELAESAGAPLAPPDETSTNTNTSSAAA